MSDVQSINIIQSYFNTHVSNLGKTFDPSSVHTEKIDGHLAYIWGCIIKTLDGVRITYKHDGVKIKYEEQVKTILGDTDTFSDIFIYVDKKLIHNKENF
jgi:hypothetical protein